MTTFEKSVGIMADVIEKHRNDTGAKLARRCLDALREKRIVPRSIRASEELFTRFHAHTRYLGEMTGRGYRHYYDLAVRHAVTVGDWPMVVRQVMITLPGGETFWRDVQLPDSTTKARTSHLMIAYGVIEDEAKLAGVSLPEGDG